jgi:SAM-dependent methyltransferase
MQQRHQDRKQYFYELANTAREFYLNYLQPHITLSPNTRVLEIGCGEGGNLLPFAEQGCKVTGIDICKERINEAQTFFTECHQQGTFICQDFLLSGNPKTEDERYDLVLVHDVIEHIEPNCKRDFLLHIKSFLKHNGIAFFGFPAWQNPFGGHQQISVGLASKLPFIHLLPKPLYKALLKTGGATASSMDELMSIRASRMTVEGFERLISEVGYTICQRTLWFINPHYKQKFHINPRRQWTLFASIPYLRNFYTTSAWYLLRQTQK